MNGEKDIYLHSQPNQLEQLAQRRQEAVDDLGNVALLGFTDMEYQPDTAERPSVQMEELQRSLGGSAILPEIYDSRTGQLDLSKLELGHAEQLHPATA